MPQAMSREIFRLWAPLQRRRYERVEGVPVEMAAERIGHVRLKHRVCTVLERAIREAGLACEALADGVTVEVGGGTDFEPDALVNCGAPMDADAIVATNPVIVVEVLSPSTEAVDVTDKLAGYFRVASIHHYLIVRSRAPGIIHHNRAGEVIATSEIESGQIRLDPPGIVVEVSAIYGAP